MAFLEIKNKKDFALRFIKNSIEDKKVSLEEMEELQNAEIRRKKDWYDWNEFQRKYRSKASRIDLEELGEDFETVNNNHIINNTVNDLDIKIMKASYERRTNYVRRLKYILFLVSDEEYAVIDDVKYSMSEIYNLLVKAVQEDAERELHDQIAIATYKLELNDMNIRQDNKYFLNDYKRKKLEKEVSEYHEMLDKFDKGGYPSKNLVPDILNICNESSIITYKAIFNVTFNSYDNQLESTSSLESEKNNHI